MQMNARINIVEERLARSMSQKRLAHEAGIDPRTLRKIEKGEIVSPESYRSVLAVLGLADRRNPLPDASAIPVHAVPGETPPWWVCYSWPVAFATALLGIASFATVILFTAVQLSPNADIHLTTGSICTDDTPKAVSDTIASELGLKRPRVWNASFGTSGCSFRMTGYLPNAADSRDKALGKLRGMGYEAEVSVARRYLSF